MQKSLFPSTNMTVSHTDYLTSLDLLTQKIQSFLQCKASRSQSFQVVCKNKFFGLSSLCSVSYFLLKQVIEILIQKSEISFTGWLPRANRISAALHYVVPKIRILSPGVQKSRSTHRVEIFVYFMSAQRWVLGGNSTKLAHLVNTW